MIYNVSCDIFGKAVHFSKKDTLETIEKKIIAILNIEPDKISDICINFNIGERKNILNIIFSAQINGIKEDKNWSTFTDSFWVVRTDDDKFSVKVISDVKFKESWKNISGVIL